MQNEQTSRLIDSIIIDCNDSVKMIMSGNYIAWCGLMVKTVQKLSALKDEIGKGGESNGNS